MNLVTNWVSMVHHLKERYNRMNMTNEVKLAGTVSTMPVKEESFNGEGIYSFILAVTNKDKVDSILVRVSDRFLDFKKIEVGSYIMIRGSMRSVNKASGYKHLIVSVFASSIRVLDEEGEPMNEVTLQGKLCQKYFYKEATDDRVQFCDRMVRTTRSTGKCSNIPVACRGRNAEYLASLETGTLVTCKGVLRERKYRKTIDDECRLITTLELVASTITCSEAE